MKTRNKRLMQVRLLDAALACAAEVGYNAMTRQDIAERAGCSEGLVSHYLGDMDNARAITLRYALVSRDWSVFLQGLILGHQAALDAPEEDRLDAVETLLKEQKDV